VDAARARYDEAVNAQAARGPQREGRADPAERSIQHPPGPALLRRLAARARNEVRLAALAVWRGLTGFYNSDDLTFASSIAYYALLSLLPFFLLVFAVLGNITSNASDRLVILDFVLNYFPRKVDFVDTQLKNIEQSRIQLGVAGSVLMVWAAMGVFGALTSAINHAWGVEKQPNFFKHKLISFVMLVMAGVLLLAGLLLVSAIDVSQAKWFAQVIANSPRLLILQGLALRWASLLLFIIIVGLVFYFVPNAKVRFRDVWLGAILTGLLWRGALAGFSLYVRDMNRLTSVHGSIATVVAFLLWVYISAVILLYGAEVTAAYARLRRRRPDEIPAAPTPRL
jgi:membrane protein